MIVAAAIGLRKLHADRFAQVMNLAPKRVDASREEEREYSAKIACRLIEYLRGDGPDEELRRIRMWRTVFMAC